MLARPGPGGPAHHLARALHGRGHGGGQRHAHQLRPRVQGRHRGGGRRRGGVPPGHGTRVTLTAGHVARVWSPVGGGGAGLQQVLGGGAAPHSEPSVRRLHVLRFKT